MRHLNQLGLDLIKIFEGCELTAYRDIVGVWTIGYGSTGKHVKPGMVITKEQAEELLKQDLQRFEIAVEDRTKSVEVTDNQFAAMVSLAYNVGIANFSNSSVLRRLLAGNIEGAADAFLMWNKAGGNVVKGLTRRRAAERELFLKV